jgi:RHS repeat-associated protein
MVGLDVENSASGTTMGLTHYGLDGRCIDVVSTTTSSGNTVSYPLYDAHGNNVGLLGKNGSSFLVSNEKSYDAWGGLRTGTNANGKAAYCANRGHKQDDESGLIYMRARYYEPTSGRFVSEDPAMDGWNYYMYACNSPTVFVDSKGTHYEVVIDGYKFFFDNVNGNLKHLHVYELSSGQEVYSRLADGKVWHGKVTGELPKKVFEALFKAARSGQSGARQVILRMLAEGGYGIAEELLEKLAKSFKPKGGGPAMDSITACFLADPLLFIDIMKTIAGKD